MMNCPPHKLPTETFDYLFENGDPDKLLLMIAIDSYF